mgnify:CR=1 FL=1
MRTHGGKGDKRRKPTVDNETVVSEWERIFSEGGKCPECTKYQCICPEEEQNEETNL